jgi:Escherichia/Staphylococcus phage prohead protease
MTIIRQMMPANVKTLGDDEVEVIVSTSELARDGHVIDVAGMDLANFRRNPIVLWQHLPECPVGRAETIRLAGDKILARVKFAPTGVSEIADQTRGLVKAGIVTGVSCGFDPIETEPLDQYQPRGGQLISKSELLEFSFASIPVDVNSIVTARAARGGRPRNAAIERADPIDALAAALAGLAPAHGRLPRRGAVVPLRHVEVERWPQPVRPIGDGDPAHTAHFSYEIRGFLVADALYRGEAMRRSRPLSFAERQAEAARLARAPE